MVQNHCMNFLKFTAYTQKKRKAPESHAVIF